MRRKRVRKAAQIAAAEHQVGSTGLERSQHAGSVGGRVGVVAVEKRHDLGAFGQRGLGASPARGAVAWLVLDQHARAVGAGDRGGRIGRAADDHQDLVDRGARHLVQHRADRFGFVPGRDDQRHPGSTGHGFRLPQCRWHELNNPNPSPFGASLSLARLPRPQCDCSIAVAWRVRGPRPRSVCSFAIERTTGQATGSQPRLAADASVPIAWWLVCFARRALPAGFLHAGHKTPTLG